MNTLTTVTETTLIKAAQTGQAEAFQQLILAYQAAVLGFLYRLGNDRDTAQDLAQETFIKAWLGIRAYRHEQKFRAWLLKIAYHITIDHWRKNPPTTDFLAETFIDEAQPTPEAQIGHLEEAERVKQAVQSLPHQSRTALIMREYYALSYQEIADTLNIPLGTVMSRLNYARNRLKKSLEPLMEELYA